MDHRAISVDEQAGAVWIRLVRPEQMNPLDALCVEELRATIREAPDSDPVAVVFTGQGRVFSAGADLKMARRLATDGDGASSEMSAFLRAAGDLMREIESLPIPTIAAVNGMALAGGVELVLACDLAIAAESAQLGDAHANFGLLPGAGGSQRLPRVVGLRHALHLLYTGEFITASRAREIGLVNDVVPDDRLEAAVDELVAALAKKSPRGLARMKSLVRGAFDLSLEAGLAREYELSLEHVRGPDVREGLAAFAEKRAPRFRDL